MDLEMDVLMLATWILISWPLVGWLIMYIVLKPRTIGDLLGVFLFGLLGGWILVPGWLIGEMMMSDIWYRRLPWIKDDK